MPVRADQRDDPPMKQSKRSLRRYLKAVSEGADRSSLFWWMVEHFDETVRAAKGRRMPWAVLCQQYAEFGLTDGSGDAPSQEAARRTWRSVRVEMAKTAAEQRTAPDTASRPPARQSPNWQPPVVATGRPAPAPAPSRNYDPDEEELPPRAAPDPAQPAAGASQKKMTIDDLSPEARAKIDKLRRQFAETDRKRFGGF